MIKICPKCKNMFPVDRMSCPKCGNHDFLIGCPKCGKVLPKGEITCPVCGDSVSKDLVSKNNKELPMQRKGEKASNRKGMFLFIAAVLFPIIIVVIAHNFRTLCGAFGHKWNAATCTEAKICSICGTREGSELGHKWEGGDCTTKQVCSVCGITGDYAHVINENTCGSIICEKCGETVGYKDHKYDSKNVCKYCGSVKEITYNSVEYNSDDYWNGVVTAQNLVKNELKSPSSAQFPRGENAYIVKKSIDGDFIVSGYVDAANSFGTMLRKNWIVTFKMGDTVGDKYYVSNTEVAFY